MRLCPPLKSATMSMPREKRSLDTLHTDLCCVSGAVREEKEKGRQN